jgi:hypothetical protein
MGSSRKILLLGLALLHIACFETKAPDDVVTGTSTTSGNPTEIQLGFVDGSIEHAGNVEIYASSQIPVPGFQPDPLLRFQVKGDKEYRLLASDFSSITDSLWPKSSREGDSIFRFNLVVMSDSKGAILHGLGYRPASASFAIPDSMKTPGDTEGAVMVWVDLKKRVGYKGFINPLKLNWDKLHFLFIPGTGYYAKSDSGNFDFSGLPEGRYKVNFISVPNKDIALGSTGDSTNIYFVDRSLSGAAVDTLTITGVEERISLPSKYLK